MNKLRRARLRLSNKLFHNNIVNHLPTSIRGKILQKRRKKHLERLKQINPLFAKLLSKSKKFSDKVSGKEYSGELLMVGAGEINFWVQGNKQGMVPMRVAIIIDELGRARFYSKINTKARKGNFWEEIRGFKLEDKFENALTTTQRPQSLTIERRQDAIYTSAIRQNEKLIDFDNEIKAEDLIEINKML
jgi:hypothetical protein